MKRLDLIKDSVMKPEGDCDILVVSIEDRIVPLFMSELGTRQSFVDDVIAHFPDVKIVGFYRHDAFRGVTVDWRHVYPLTDESRLHAVVAQARERLDQIEGVIGHKDVYVNPERLQQALERLEAVVESNFEDRHLI